MDKTKETVSWQGYLVKVERERHPINPYIWGDWSISSVTPDDEGFDEEKFWEDTDCPLDF